MRGYLRSLNPDLPRTVQTLQLGGLINAVGNGLVLPFTLIYLHNDRGISLGVAGLVLGTNAAVSLVAGPLAGIAVDRFGGRRTLTAALFFLMVGIGGYAFVTETWHAFLASAVIGVGNGAFWPSQSSLIAGLTPQHQRPGAFAMQRVVMNLGIGVGGIAGGFIAAESFRALFLLDATTFALFAFVLWSFVPSPARPPRTGQAPGRYLDVLRHRVFLALMVVNAVFITAGLAQLEILPAYVKNEAGIDERQIGQLFAVNTAVIVLLQLPIAKLAQGRRRMPIFALMAVTWAVSWAVVPVGGLWLEGAAAFLLFAAAVSLFGVGECLHGAVQAPLVADLADPRLLGRYMAVSALSWQVGFTIGPAAGAALLAQSPTGVWLAAAAVCLLGGLAALALEPALPPSVRRTPRRDAAPAMAPVLDAATPD